MNALDAATVDSMVRQLRCHPAGKTSERTEEWIASVRSGLERELAAWCRSGRALTDLALAVDQTTGAVVAHGVSTATTIDTEAWMRLEPNEEPAIITPRADLSFGLAWPSNLTWPTVGRKTSQ